MRDFQSYITEKKVVKRRIDVELANSLLNTVETREESVINFNIHEQSLLIFENLYDCFRELIDAILALEGYKSYSHEAAISYLKVIGFSEEIIITLDRFRKNRNDSKYYGIIPKIEDAEEMRSIYIKEKKRLLEIIHKKLK